MILFKKIYQNIEKNIDFFGNSVNVKEDEEKVLCKRYLNEK